MLKIPLNRSMFRNLLINYDILLLQALSKALTELRADMVTQAQEQVKTHAEDSSQQINVQKLIDKL